MFKDDSINLTYKRQQLPETSDKSVRQEGGLKKTLHCGNTQVQHTNSRITTKVGPLFKVKALEGS